MAQKKESVSVVVPLYNAESTIVQCIEALLGQTVPIDEIIIVDNNSKDNSYEVVRKFIENNSSRGNVRVVKEPKKGAASARNAGMNLAVSGIIAFTDQDCIPPPNWIENVIAAFENNSNAAMVAGVGRGAFTRTAIEKFTYLMREKTNSLSGACEFGEISCFTGPVFMTMNAAVKRIVLSEGVRFDESFPAIGGEDVDICMQALKKGMHVMFLPELYVLHQERNRITDIYKQNYSYTLSEALILKKYFADEMIVINLGKCVLRRKSTFGTVKIDKLLWLVMLVLVMLLFIVAGWWLVFCAALLSAAFVIRTFGNIKRNYKQLNIKWSEIFTIAFCYFVKQAGDISGRVAGSLKNGILNI